MEREGTNSGKSVESGVSRGKGKGVATADVEEDAPVAAPATRTLSEKGQKWRNDKGKGKMSEAEEVECESKTKKGKWAGQRSNTKLDSGELSVVRGNTEPSVNTNPIDNQHIIWIDRLPYVREDDETGPGSAFWASFHNRVKETVRSFNKYYLSSVQEEEERCKKKSPEGETSDQTNEVEKPTRRRPDVKAMRMMKNTGSVLFQEKMIGSVPGINVGYQFFSRAEMCAIGFHHPTMGGIDYIGEGLKKNYRNYQLPVAVSVIISGVYEDDMDNLEEIVYTGEGGRGKKHQERDQELQRGNLALKNCIQQSIPVRLIRGHTCDKSYVRKVFTYDGLYAVVKYVRERGNSGYYVCKYTLRRLGGQPSLTTNQVHFAFRRAPEQLSSIEGLQCADISMGKERIPIPATNVVDYPPFAPSGFIYHESMEISENVNLPPNATACNCKGTCSSFSECKCAILNGSHFPYVCDRVDGGKYFCYRLVESKDVVFECTPDCDCEQNCINKASQRGLEYKLEVFRTANKGWGVRSWEHIPSGGIVGEYIGTLKRTSDMDSAHTNDYILEIDCLHTMMGLGGRQKRLGNVSDSLLGNEDESADLPDPEYCIDAGSSGNVSRFFNHSCDPNLFVQCVLSSHHDPRLARIVFVASYNIPPMQELTFDYGYVLDSVTDSDGMPKQQDCHCGAASCKKRLY